MKRHVHEKIEIANFAFSKNLNSKIDSHVNNSLLTHTTTPNLKKKRKKYRFSISDLIEHTLAYYREQYLGTKIILKKSYTPTLATLYHQEKLPCPT